MAIVGEKLQDYVVNQINQRQKGLGDITKTDENLAYFNAKTAWVKLSSGVSLTSDKILGSLSSNYLAQGVGSGKELAEKYVLFGGTAEKNGNILNQRQGLGGTSDSYSFNPDFGVVPFPGIKDVSIRCLNRGSLKKAKIKLRVEDRYQLEIIDILYLRLGYTLFLEWGNSHYLDNSGNTKKTSTTLTEKYFFSQGLGSSYNDLFPKIELQRKETNGNYDGFIGKVSNFDWGFNEDGSYDINLELISLGDVIESLKSNVVLDYKTNDFIERTTSGSSNIVLTSDNIINNNKTTNTLFSILYLWKEQNANPINFNNYGPSVNFKALDSTFDLNATNSQTSYIGDVLSVPTSSTTSFSTVDVSITVSIQYINPLDGEFQTRRTVNGSVSYDYLIANYSGATRLDGPGFLMDTAASTLNRPKNFPDGNLGGNGDGFFAFPDAQTYTYTDKLTGTILNNERQILQNFSTLPTSGSTSTQSGLTYLSFTEIQNLVQNYLNYTTDYPSDPKGKKVWNPNSPEGKKWQSSLTTSGIWKKIANNLIIRKLKWTDFPSSNSYRHVTTLNRYRLFLSQIKGTTTKSKSGLQFGNYNPFNRFQTDANRNYKLHGSGRRGLGKAESNQPIDVPFISIKVTQATPASSITIGNPLRKFKDGDVARLYTKDDNNNPLFSYYMRFGAVLQVLKDEILSKIKTTSSTYSNYPSIININNNNNYGSPGFVSYMKNKPNLTSFDISKCIVNSTIEIETSGSSDKTNYNIFNKKGVFSTRLEKWAADSKSANSMNVYLNFEFIGDALQSNTDKEGSISVYSFIKELCDGINRSFANVTNLEPVIDETTNVLSIVDSSNNRSQGGDSYQLNPFGFINDNTEGSFVRKVDLKTAITPGYATMVTVGATAGGYVKGVEATAFATWNSGIKDRFKTELVPASKDAGITTFNQSIQDSFNNFFRTFTVTNSNALLPFGVTTNLSTDLQTLTADESAGHILIDNNIISKNLEIATEYFRAYSAEEKDGGSIGFIPFNVGLKMDGISGIKIYNEILLNTRFLPPNYSNSLSFITTAVNHSLKDGDWETELKLTLIPTPKKGNYNTPQRPSFITTTAGTGTGGTTSKYTSTPVVSYTSTKLSYADTKRFLQLVTSDTCLQKAVFAILSAEASKYGSGTTGGFNSAGGYNFAGVQTDNAIWGGNLNSYASKRITGQFQRVDGGGVLRWFAAFDDDTGFLEFMTNRVQNKGFDGCDGNKWVTTYINSWWSPAAKASYTVGTPTFNSKLSIFNSAITIFNSLP